MKADIIRTKGGTPLCPNCGARLDAESTWNRVLIKVSMGYNSFSALPPRYTECPNCGADLTHRPIQPTLRRDRDPWDAPARSSVRNKAEKEGLLPGGTWLLLLILALGLCVTLYCQLFLTGALVISDDTSNGLVGQVTATLENFIINENKVSLDGSDYSTYIKSETIYNEDGSCDSLSYYSSGWVVACCWDKDDNYLGTCKFLYEGDLLVYEKYLNTDYEIIGEVTRDTDTGEVTDAWGVDLDGNDLTERLP